MRKAKMFVAFCMSVLMVAASAVMLTSAVAPAADTILATAVYGTPVELDGKLDNGWDAANIYENKAFVGAEENETDIAAKWRVMYDNAFLYFFIEVNDSTVGDADYEYSADGSYYAKNSIHLMFDLGYERGPSYDDNDFYIDLSSQGYYNNHKSEALDFVEYATVLTDTGYCCEVKVDFDFYPDFKAEEGTCFGFDLWANDNIPPLSGRIFARTWADSSDASWNNPTKMGTVQLGAKPADAKTTTKDKKEVVIEQYPGIADDIWQPLIKGDELKNLGASYTGITNAENPQGGGSKDIAVIVDGNRKGNDSDLQYDAFGATFTDDLGLAGEQWFGADLGGSYVVSSVIFWEGGQWGDGGWFGTSPRLQIMVGGSWVDADFTITPTYPGDSADEQAPSHSPYIFALADPVECTAVRVIGGMNSLAGHASCAEIEVFGYTVDGYAVLPVASAEVAAVDKSVGAVSVVASPKTADAFVIITVITTLAGAVAITSKKKH